MGHLGSTGIFYQQTIPDAVFVWPIYVNLGSFGGKFVGKLYHALKASGNETWCWCNAVISCPTCRFNYSGPGENTLQGTNISHLRKRKIIFKMPFLGDMLVPSRVYTIVGGSTHLKNISQNGNLPLVWGEHQKKIETATWYMTRQYKT